MRNYLNEMIQSKKQYKQYKKEKAALPADYKAALDALERYMWNYAKDDTFFSVIEELLHMFQESSIEKIPLKEIIGDDPVAFADDILFENQEKTWLFKSKEKLQAEIRKIGRD